MREHKGRIVEVHRPPPEIRRSVKRTTRLPRPAQVSVLLESGETLPCLPEPAGVRLMPGDRVTLHADLTRRGTIGALRKDD